MNLEDTHQLFQVAAIVCAFGVALNLFMLKRRGASAALLAGAFLCLGIASFLYSDGVSLLLTIPLAIITLALLVADFLLRMKKLGGQ